MNKDIAEVIREELVNGLKEKYPNSTSLIQELKSLKFVEKEQSQKKIKVLRSNNEFYIYPNMAARDLVDSLYDTILMSKFSLNKPVRTGEKQIEKIIPSKGLFFETAIRKYMVNSFCESFSKKEVFKDTDFAQRNSNETNYFSEGYDLEVLNGLASNLGINTDKLCRLITEKHLVKSDEIDRLCEQKLGDKLAFDKIEVSLDYALETKMINRSPFSYYNEANKKFKGISEAVKEKANKCLSYATEKCVSEKDSANKFISENKISVDLSKAKDNKDKPKKRRGLFSRLFGWMFRRKDKNKEVQQQKQENAEVSNASVEPVSLAEIEEIEKESSYKKIDQEKKVDSEKKEIEEKKENSAEEIPVIKKASPDKKLGGESIGESSEKQNGE